MVQDVERVCCQNDLAAAERHMNEGEEHPCGGECRFCSHCVMCCFDEAAPSIKDTLNAEYGICREAPDEPFIVPLDQWHDWEDCWTPWVELGGES